MTVVIHEFEVVAEPQPPPAPAEVLRAAAVAPQSASATHDVARILRRQAERLARVRAD